MLSQRYRRHPTVQLVPRDEAIVSECSPENSSTGAYWLDRHGFGIGQGLLDDRFTAWALSLCCPNVLMVQAAE